MEINSSISPASKNSSTEKIKLRLFGVELDPSRDKGSPESGDESVDSSASSAVTAVKSPKGGEPSRDAKKIECQYCCKVFANSQALGGHMNAHKKESMKKKKLQLQARNGSFYKQPSYYNLSERKNDRLYSYCGSNSAWLYDESLHLHEYCKNKETYISFGHPGANLRSNDFENLKSCVEYFDCISKKREDKSRKRFRPTSNK